MLTLPFRIRRIYYDPIVAGSKTAEVRRASVYWESMATLGKGTLDSGDLLIAEFWCGKDKHRREIVSIERFETAKEALGREPSEQGKLDIGEGAVFRFNLGQEYRGM